MTTKKKDDSADSGVPFCERSATATHRLAVASCEDNVPSCEQAVSLVKDLWTYPVPSGEQANR